MKQYYIIRNDQQNGPYTLEELGSMSITPDTIVWTEGMKDWAPAREVSELNTLFDSSSQTPPHYDGSAYGAAPQYHSAPPQYSNTPQHNSTPQYNSAPQYNPAPQYSSSPQGVPSEHRPMPPNYLAWSIVVTILCCLIGGIVAIIYSTQVSSRYMAGDYEGAERASRNARTWIIVSASVGGLVSIIYLIWYFFFAAAAGVAALSEGFGGFY